jgi:hypothetical protein
MPAQDPWWVSRAAGSGSDEGSVIPSYPGPWSAPPEYRKLVAKDKDFDIFSGVGSGEQDMQPKVWRRSCSSTAEPRPGLCRAPGVHEAAGQRCKPGSGTHSVEYRSPQVTSSGSLLEPHRTPRRDPAGAARAAPCRAQGQVGAVQEQGQVGGDDVIRSRRAQHRPGVRPSEVGVADAVGHLGGVLAAHAARVDTRPAGWILGGLVGGPPGCGPPTTERLAAHAAGAAALRSIHSGGRWCR